jgi:hypothetical protein
MTQDTELLELVRDDLIYLKNEWNNEISDSALRRSSNVLRNLITYDLLGKASRHLNYDYRIKSNAIEKEKLLNLFPQDKINLFVAGGANYGNVMIENLLELGMVLQQKDISNLMDVLNSTKVRNEYSLENYKSLTTIIVNGIIISKNNLIQYIANKKGGTHYDTKRESNNKGDIYKKIDEIFKTYEIAGKNIAYFELLSIGQEIVENKHTDILLEKIINAV